MFSAGIISSGYEEYYVKRKESQLIINQKNKNAKKNIISLIITGENIYYKFCFCIEVNLRGR